QEAKIEDPAGTSEPKPTVKPFGDLEARILSVKLLPGDVTYGGARMTLVITNTSASKTYGVAVADQNRSWHLTNNPEEGCERVEVNGIATGGLTLGTPWGSFTDIPPRSAVTVIGKTSVRWTGKPGDYRPYRLQTEVLFGVEVKGRYLDLKKHNLVLDVK